MSTFSNAPKDSMRTRMEAMVHGIQDEICDAIAKLDGTPFQEDHWDRPGGGGGRSRVLQDGNVFEKAGVGVSVVMGTLSPEAAAKMGGGTNIEDLTFYATGVSLVFHPHNPMAPTVHANYRYFERGDGSAPGSWWFGGGCDLTPSYLFEDDAQHFHKTYLDACNRHDPTYYPQFKKQCDEYFYIPHRKESRGLGGIFFDNLQDNQPDSADKFLAFVTDCAQAFLPSYMPIIERRKNMPFEQHHKEWQQMRRGRYVVFNLVYDRGTHFGLRTDGRIESILMSLPLTARWQYDHHPAPESEEARLVDVLQNPRSWT